MTTKKTMLSYVMNDILIIIIKWFDIKMYFISNLSLTMESNSKRFRTAVTFVTSVVTV
jgi:hypothetical protein